MPRAALTEKMFFEELTKWQEGAVVSIYNGHIRCVRKADFITHCPITAVIDSKFGEKLTLSEAMAASAKGYLTPKFARAVVRAADQGYSLGAAEDTKLNAKAKRVRKQLLKALNLKEVE